MPCQLLSEVYRTAKRQIKAAVAALKEELSVYRSDVEKKISAGLQEASLLQDHVAHTITGACFFYASWCQKINRDRVLHLSPFLLPPEDMCEPMLKSLARTITPRLNRTLREVAAPTCDGFASAWQYFLETCDGIVELGSKSTSVKDVKTEVRLGSWLI